MTAINFDEKSFTRALLQDLIKATDMSINEIKDIVSVDMTDIARASVTVVRLKLENAINDDEFQWFLDRIKATAKNIATSIAFKTVLTVRDVFVRVMEGVMELIQRVLGITISVPQL